MVETPFLGDVMVLWSLASKQNDDGGQKPTRSVRFRSIAGGDCEMDIPELLFHEPLSDAEQL
jgi:hypothetical protein